MRSTFEDLVVRHERPLLAHLRRLVGDPELARDLRQEVFLRAYRYRSPEAADGQLRAWLYRIATNLAIDALRRRHLKRWLPFDAAVEGEAASRAPDDLARSDERAAIEDALAALSTEQRLALALHFEAGYSLGEVGQFLGIGADAARKRVARARAAFVAAYRRAGGEGRGLPRIAVVYGSVDPAPYLQMVRQAGGEVLPVPVADGGDAALARYARCDGLLLLGGPDIHPVLYGEAPHFPLETPDLAQDRIELALLRQALADDRPVMGICRGMQMLNVALGGDLYQDLASERPNGVSHGSWTEGRIIAHRMDTRAGTLVRRVVGRAAAEVTSNHHQVIRRLGNGLVVSGQAPDGLVEAVEVAERRFAVGVQWHPELISHWSRAARRLWEDFLTVATRAARN